MVDLDDLYQSSLLVSKLYTLKPCNNQLGQTVAVHPVSCIQSNFHDIHLKLRGKRGAFKALQHGTPVYWLKQLSSRTIYGLVASQVGDYHNELALMTGGTTTPADFIRTSYGYKHDFLGKHLLSCTAQTPPVALRGNPAQLRCLQYRNG